MASNFVALTLLSVMTLVMVAPGYAQISTPCNASMLGSLFTPCVSFLTSSSANGTSPTTECCSALKSVTSGGMDCLCLIVTASVPFRIPINRTLAISLPRACNMPGVPVQCKASGSPLPAPGPGSLGPSPSPLSAASPTGFTPTPSPQASSILPSPISPSMAPPESDTTPLSTPPSPSVDSGTPFASTGSGRSNLTPSSAMPSYNVSSSVLLLITMGFSVLKYY